MFSDFLSVYETLNWLKTFDGFHSMSVIMWKFNRFEKQKNKCNVKKFCSNVGDICLVSMFDCALVYIEPINESQPWKYLNIYVTFRFLSLYFVLRHFCSTYFIYVFRPDSSAALFIFMHTILY